MPKASTGWKMGRGEVFPTYSRLEGLGASEALPAGYRTEPRPKLNFVKSECQRSHLMVCISDSLTETYKTSVEAFKIYLMSKSAVYFSASIIDAGKVDWPTLYYRNIINSTVNHA